MNLCWNYSTKKGLFAGLTKCNFVLRAGINLYYKWLNNRVSLNSISATLLGLLRSGILANLPQNRTTLGSEPVGDSGVGAELLCRPQGGGIAQVNGA